MKFIMENWRKIHEGEVLDFPTSKHEPEMSEEDMQRLIILEGKIESLLVEFYGNVTRIPLPIIETFEQLIDKLEESKKI